MTLRAAGERDTEDTLREVVHTVRAVGTLLFGVAAVTREVRGLVREARRHRAARRPLSLPTDNLRRYVPLEREDE